MEIYIYMRLEISAYLQKEYVMWPLCYQFKLGLYYDVMLRLQEMFLLLLFQVIIFGHFYQIWDSKASIAIVSKDTGRVTDRSNGQPLKAPMSIIVTSEPGALGCFKRTFLPVFHGEIWSVSRCLVLPTPWQHVHYSNEHANLQTFLHPKNPRGIWCC